MTADVVTLATNLALNLGYHVFPVREDKKPTISRWPEQATDKPAHIEYLWRTRPGPLIGITTGAQSNISVLDLDAKHPEARDWWLANHKRLLPTRAYRTRSGGIHLYFRHRNGVVNSASKIAPGVDTRGTGGYVVSWSAAGLECLDHTRAQPLPDWLFEALTVAATGRPPPKTIHSLPNKQYSGIVHTLALAKEGNRNATLYWCARTLTAEGWSLDDIEYVLLPVAHQIGIEPNEARPTIRSAQRTRQ
jgi:Bifunctional DNA primase/polymerase, N-terminal